MSSAMRNGLVLMTGANGFVGRSLLARMDERSVPVRAAARCDLSGRDTFRVGEVDGSTPWAQALQGCASVVHLAARVHVMEDRLADPLAEFRRINFEGTLNLARQAAQAGVTRFVYMSSIKVNGEATTAGRPFMADDPANPVGPYSTSKAEAEEGLRLLAKETGMEVVIIRPVLVYGPGVKANFLSMMRWIKKRFPLPLGAIHNSRSLVAVDNLVDLVITCLRHPAAGNQIFLVSDGEDLSTTDLLRRTATAMGTRSRLLPVPTSFLEAVAAIVGKREMAQRLCGALQVDIEKTRRLLDWSPPVSVDHALRETVDYFLTHQA